MPNQTLICETFFEPLAAFVARAGISDFKPEAFVAKRRLSNPHAEPQVSGDKVIRFFEDVAGRLNRPSFGLEYAEAFPVGGTGAFGFIVANAQDMRHAVEAIARYTQIVIDGLAVHYEPVEGGAQLSWRYPVALTDPHIQFNSCIAALVVLRLRSGLVPNWNPMRVQLDHPEPGCIETYKRVFGPNLEFEQPVNCLTFRDTYLDRPNAAANPRLFNTVKQLGEILLGAHATGTTFRTTIANKTVDLLGMSDPTINEVAEALGLSRRTVQRRLAAEGTTFDEVLNDTRRHVAERLLRDSNLPLTDIAFMLGFSELSAFTRAAKRWHGVPPRAFRAKSREAAQ